MNFVILVTILFPAPKTPSAYPLVEWKKKNGWMDGDEPDRKLG